MDDFCLPPSTQSPLAAVSAIDDADAQETLRAIVFANYDHVFGPIALQIFANFAVNGNADYWRELGTRWSRLMLSCEWNSNDSLLEDYKEEWSVKQKFAKMPDTGKITALICRRSDQVSAILAIDRSVFHHNLSYLLSDITEGSWQSDPCPSSISIQSYVQSLRCQQQLKQPLNWKLLESNFTWKFLSMAITAHLQSRYTLLFAGTHHSIFSELRRLLQLLSSPRQAIFFIQQIPEGSYATDSCLITPVSVYTKNQRSFCKPDQAEERWTEFNRQSIIIKRLTDSLSQVPRSLRELFITRQFQPYLDRLSFVLLRSLQPYLCATAGHSTVPGNHGTPPAAGSSFTSPFTSPHSSPNLPPSTGTSSSTPTLKTHHNNQSMNHLPFTTVRKSLFGGAAATEEDLNNSSTTTPIKILPRIQAIFYNLLLPQPEAYYDDSGKEQLEKFTNANPPSTNPRKPTVPSAVAIATSSSSPSASRSSESLLHMNSNFLRRTLGASAVQSIVRFMNTISMTSTPEDHETILDDPDFSLIIGWTSGRFRHTLHTEILKLL